MPSKTTKRSRRSPAALAVVALLLGSCAHRPPGRRNAEKPAEKVVEQPDFGPSAPKPTPGAAAVGPAAPTPKINSGSGSFVNTKPAGEPAAPGPEEVSLNFEGLDVREVAKVILGDYLKLSYTVHPAVAGTVTFRTVRPI